VTDLKKWVEDNFFDPGYEVDSIVPEDWKAHPKILDHIKDEKVQVIANAIHLRWKELVRIYNSSRLNPDSVSSHLPLQRPFVVPGGRFTEFYYWDSFWILQGTVQSNIDFFH
jgi:alpha,alpha-trehalase